MAQVSNKITPPTRVHRVVGSERKISPKVYLWACVSADWLADAGVVASFFRADCLAGVAALILVVSERAAALAIRGIGWVTARRRGPAGGGETEPRALIDSIGKVFSRARRCLLETDLAGLLSLAGDGAGEDIFEAAEPVGMIIVGSGAVSFFLGAAGRPGSVEVLSRAFRWGWAGSRLAGDGFT